MAIRRFGVEILNFGFRALDQNDLSILVLVSLKSCMTDPSLETLLPRMHMQGATLKFGLLKTTGE
eukprot:1273959-Karenia_brevis.AAC.1